MAKTLQIKNTYTKQTIIEEVIEEVNEVEFGDTCYTANGKDVAVLDFVPNVGFLVTNLYHRDTGWLYRNGQKVLMSYLRDINQVGLRFVRELYADEDCTKLIGSFRIVKKPVKVYKKKED